MNRKTRKIKGIDANTLKWIAVLTMIIDHVGASIIYQMVVKSGGEQGTLYLLYQCMRKIGRLAFPIYCFFIVEGLKHTKNVRKYILRLFIFAIISEIPFDYAFFGQIYWKHQNVFFTLAIGLWGIWGLKVLDNRMKMGIGQMLVKTCLIFGVVSLAELLMTDYSSFGVFMIVLLYLFQGNRLVQCGIGAIGFVKEITAPLAFVPLYFYNGERGRKMNKFVFYGIYPVHLLVLAVIRFLCF